MNIESTGIAQEEPVFFDTTDQFETTEKEVWKLKEEKQNAIANNPPVVTVSCFYATDLHKDNECEQNTIRKTITHSYRT